MKRILLILPILSLMACATSQFGWAPDPAVDGDKKTEMNEDFDFVELDDDELIIESDASKETASKVTASSDRSSGSEMDSDVTNKDESTMILGHRVQLASFEDESNAREARKDALFKFQHKVYLIFDSGLWKLRIGDCRTPEEADALRDLAVRRGYPGAYKVVSKVYQNTN